MWGRQTFELTRTSEAGVVSPVRDDAAVGTCRAYNACRNASGCNEGLGRTGGRRKGSHDGSSAAAA